MSYFRYIPRSAQQWAIRASQNAGPAVQPVASVPVHRGKLTLSTLCACGHARGNHCLRFACFHWPAAAGQTGYFSCLYEHCNCAPRGVPCPCDGFRLQAGDAIQAKRPRADDFTKCVECGHWRAHHCTVRRKEPAHIWEYAGFEFLSESHPYLCKHYVPDAIYKCTTSACALSECNCARFVSPYARQRKAATKKPAPKAALPDAQLFLFSDACEDQPHA